jgi:hypothetical protein
VTGKRAIPGREGLRRLHYADAGAENSDPQPQPPES